MRKFLFLLLSAALILGSCTPSEPNLKKTDYQKLAHSTVGMTSAKAEKTLTRQGFTAADASARTDGLEAILADKTYKFESKDGSIVLVVALSLKNDTVRQYILSAEMWGQEHLQDVQKLYTDWSAGNYSTLYGDISIWSGTMMSEGEETEMYVDGGLTKSFKTMIQAYYMSGEMDEETYQYFMHIFNNKRADFKGVISSSDFLRPDGEQAVESYIHLTSGLDIIDLATSLSKLKGTVGLMSGARDDEDGTPHWMIATVYLNEQDVSDIINTLPL